MFLGFTCKERSKCDKVSRTLADSPKCSVKRISYYWPPNTDFDNIIIVYCMLSYFLSRIKNVFHYLDFWIMFVCMCLGLLHGTVHLH